MRLLRRSRPDPEPPPGPLADLAAAPPYAHDTPLVEVELIALDLEATGLDPSRHEVLSFGLVPVLAGEIRLGGARHLPVRPQGAVGESAVVHGLTDDVLETAPPVADVLPAVLAAFTGVRRRVLLAHFAQVETSFLDARCRDLFGTTVPWHVVDTMELQRQLLGAHYHELRPGALRLDASRSAHGLPRYGAHNATTDAIACAELFLAQCAEVEARRGRPLSLSDVLVHGSWRG